MFFANTRQEPYGSGLHYHVERFCRGRPATLYEKTICQHCLSARNNQMLGLRLLITRPYMEQQMHLQIPRNRRHSAPEAEMLLWRPIAFGGHGE